MKTKWKLLLVILLAALFIGGGLWAADQSQARPPARTQALAAFCSSSYCLDWNVMSGGVSPMDSSSFSLVGTLNQTIIGSYSNSNYLMDTGFWASTKRHNDIQLPIILKN